MRKIARAIAQAIANGKSICNGNTSYDMFQGTVNLHGNRILYRDGDVFRIDLDTCIRWQTVTTRSRVNDICSLMGGDIRLIQRRGDLIVYLGRDGCSDPEKLTRDPVAFTDPVIKGE